MANNGKHRDRSHKTGSNNDSGKYYMYQRSMAKTSQRQKFKQMRDEMLNKNEEK